MRCECGCGYEGEDPVAQWILEEALLMLLDTPALEAPPQHAAVQRSRSRAYRQAVR